MEPDRIAQALVFPDCETWLVELETQMEKMWGLTLADIGQEDDFWKFDYDAGLSPRDAACDFGHENDLCSITYQQPLSQVTHK